MSGFWQNFKHGFMHGTFDRMFGGFGTFNFASWNCYPQFFTGNFMNMSLFRYNSPPMMQNNAWYSPQAIDFGINYQNFEYTGPNYTYDYNWSDIFVKTEQNSKSNNNNKKNTESIEELKAKWKKKKPNLNLSDEFYEKIIKISKKIKCDPNDLMGIINLETAGTFNPSEKNKIGATGLIQFLPDTKDQGDMVKRVGKRISELEKMSAEEQLDYVEKYLTSWIKDLGITGNIDGATLYSLVFWPDAAKKDLNYVIATEGSNVYTQNSGLDKDKNPNRTNNTITKKDLGERLKDFIA